MLANSSTTVVTTITLEGREREIVRKALEAQAKTMTDGDQETVLLKQVIRSLMNERPKIPRAAKRTKTTNGTSHLKERVEDAAVNNQAMQM